MATQKFTKRLPAIILYVHLMNYKICISNAVVCGGILAVIKAAWRTRTRRPGVSREKLIRLPNRSNIIAFLGTLNCMTEERFPPVMVVKLLFCRLISKILPIVMLSETGILTTCMINAAACGGILLVIAEEKEAFTVMPTLKRVTGILFPFSARIRVLFPTTSLTVCCGFLQFTHSVWDIVTKVVAFSVLISFMSPFEIVINEFSGKKLSINHLYILFCLLYSLKKVWEQKVEFNNPLRS